MARNASQGILARFFCCLLLLTTLTFPRLHAAPPDCSPTDSASFLIGAGKADVTGPTAEVGFMGFAMPQQLGQGLHTRLWSRAIAIAAPCSPKRVVLVTADILMISQVVRLEVMKRLQSLFPNGEYQDDNVLLAATHNHAGPGAFSSFTLYKYLLKGFSVENYEAIVNGIVKSITLAHQSLQPGSINLAEGDLFETNVNRSLKAYLLNPIQERQNYLYDVDKHMTLLRFDTLGGTPIASMNWFPVHATSMGNTNHLVSADNKGYGEYLFERQVKKQNSQFVSAFANANAGDASPNIYGGDNGGGVDDFESTQISGFKQYAKAIDLWQQAKTPLVNQLDYRLVWVKMDELNISPEYTGGTPQTTCPAAIGVSMLAGAGDGRGIGWEGISCQPKSNLLTKLSCRFIKTECQAEKAVVIHLGLQKPEIWTPNILPLQIIRLGELAIVGLPFEITTMAGRRLNNSILSALAPSGVTRVITAGYANSYSGYITTREEYRMQNYEGASNHFGPWTLAALQEQFGKIAQAMVDDQQIDTRVIPPKIDCCTGAMKKLGGLDITPKDTVFGQPVEQPEKSDYFAGETIKVKFWAGHPLNYTGRLDSVAKIQRYENRKWKTIAVDDDWETKVLWSRIRCGTSFDCGQVTIEWQIPPGTIPGKYRIQHQGIAKTDQNKAPLLYEGESAIIKVN